ncbi:MAG: efflux RND transporter periplasmic adaptor subunit [Alphaproteobacteria bacterium]|nr:efflux RND transporter periplasmic adaptor subunit [Alphaproteobacteria bacterium]
MNKAQLTAIAILLTGVAWIGSGVLTGNGTNPIDANADSAVNQVDAAPPSVRVIESNAQPFESDIVLQGRTAASQMVDLRAEVSGRAEEILVREGQPVTKDDAILKIAVNDRAARLNQARAAIEQRRIQVEAARQLAKQNFGTQVRLAEAEAQYQQAKADAVRFELDLANTTVRAPFDGIFDTRDTDVGAVLNVSDKIGTVVDLDPLKVTGQISERNVRDVKIGMRGSMVLSDGTEVDGEISYVASVSDPSTRTFKIELLVPNPESDILAGLAAQLRLPAGEVMAHSISPSVLTLSDSGQIGIKTVDANKTIRFWPVQILDDGPQGTWVSGLPQNATIVIVGQDYVAVGQKVAPVVVSITSDQS